LRISKEMNNLPIECLREIKQHQRQKENNNLLYINRDTPLSDIIEYLDRYNENNYPLIINYWYTEVIQDIHEAQKIKEILKNYNGRCKLSQSTIDFDENFTHPYTNIVMWENLPIRNNILNTNHHGISRLWNKSLYFESGFNDNKKTNNHILSVRRKSQYRDYIINRIPQEKISIFRYYGINEYEEKNYNEDKINFYTNGWPMWPNLVDEYKVSYISFIMETMFDDVFPYTPFSEKTLLPFITRTSPLIIAQKNVVKKLHDLGFWTMNYDFGYGQIEDLESDNKKRMDKFIDMINQITDMTDKQIHEYYHDNYKHIYQNWKLLTDIFKVRITTI